MTKNHVVLAFFAKKILNQKDGQKNAEIKAKLFRISGQKPNRKKIDRNSFDI